MVTATVYMQAWHGIQEGVKAVNDLNEALTTIHMTMNLSGGDMQELTTESQNMAKQMGLSINEVLRAVNFAA